MKAYLINMHLLVPRSRSSAKIKVKYKGYISQKMAVLRAFVFHKHRVLPRNQIHWDKWPTEFEKVGPFQKIRGASELPIYDANGLSAFRQVEKT